MQQEKDYLQREIERITLFLKVLLRRVAGLKNEDFVSQQEQLELELKNELDFCLSDLMVLSEKGLEDKITGLNEAHVELLAQILHQIALKQNPSSSKKYKKVSLSLIEHLEKNSKTISFALLQLKQNLAPSS